MAVTVRAGRQPRVEVWWSRPLAEYGSGEVGRNELSLNAEVFRLAAPMKRAVCMRVQVRTMCASRWGMRLKTRAGEQVSVAEVSLPHNY